ncbi:MAG: hypothetical protein NUW23_02810 [Firmicutes bacterium]|nr:hypothetical protein [Bacillota bacterium]
MTSRERVLTTLARKRADRPPVDGWFGPGPWHRLKAHYGTVDDESLRRQLGIDFRPIVMEPGPGFRERADFFPLNAVGLHEASYTVVPVGPGLFEDEWGVRIGVDEDGANWHYALHPLAGKLAAGDLRIDVSGRIPDLSAPGRFTAAAACAREWRKDCAVLAGVSTLFRQGWILVGFAEFLESLVLNPEGVESLLDQLFDYFVAQIRAYIDAGADIIQLLGDLGSQTSMFISPAMWRRIFKPRMKRLIEATRRQEVYYFLHSDGNIEAIVPDLIEIGIDMLNPIQPECMDPVKMKKKYGADLILYGTLSLQRTLTVGRPRDVRDEVLRRVDECGQDGGLILAPSNVITDDVPLENVVALYETVRELE